MHSTNDREFENEITNIAMSASRKGLKQYLEVLEDTNKSKEERIRSYSILFTYHRRRKNINKCIKLYNDYSDAFQGVFIYYHLYSIAIRDTGLKRDLLKSTEMAREALSLQPRNSGALHSLASLLCLRHEAEENDKPSSLLEEARDLVEDAISIEPTYPKFYSTRAQILSYLGDYQAAQKDISTAINIEDSNLKDYSLRISDYLAIKMKIELQKSITYVVENSKREIRRAVDEARRSNIEILSFFVAVVTFVIAGMNIAVKFELADASQLIFVLSSAMLMAISGFMLLYDSDGRFKRFLQTFLFSVIILFISFIVPMYVQK